MLLTFPVGGNLRERFWSVKTINNQTYDILAYGDSRMYRGLDPTIVSEQNDGKSCFNLGYSGSGFSKRAYQNIESKLHEQSTIILGITPSSLTPTGCKNDQMKELDSKSKFEHLSVIYLKDLELFYAPTNIKSVIAGINGEKLLPREIYHDNGYMQSLSKAVHENALKNYQNVFNNNQVDYKVLNELTEKIKQWRAAGHDVYCYRPPSCENMVKLETEKSGYDEARIAKAIRASGATWLSIENNLTAYDGSHLNRESVIILSKRIGEAVKQ